MPKTILMENLEAGAAISPYRIVKPGAADNKAIQAAAVSDAMFGVADSLGAAAAGDRVDVITSGVAEVELGGTVTRGGMITSDANGKGVAAAPAAGTNNRVIGIARVSGVSGDIIDVQLSPGQIQG
jgi:hypothetical protein